MPRGLHKAWQDVRPGWTRRVRWYVGNSYDISPIRLNFVDPEGECNMYYHTPDQATVDYDAFKAGELTVMQLIKRKVTT